MNNIKYNETVYDVMLVGERTIRAMGDSLYLSLPLDWARAHKVTKNTVVKVVVGEAIVVLPPRDYTNDEIEEIFARAAQVAKVVM